MITGNHEIDLIIGGIIGLIIFIIFHPTLMKLMNKYFK